MASDSLVCVRPTVGSTLIVGRDGAPNETVEPGVGSAKPRRYVPPAATRRLICRLARQVARQVGSGVSLDEALEQADAALGAR